MRFIIAIILAVSALLPASAAAVECLSSPAEVRSVHPGGWAIYHRVDGHKCWMAKGEHFDRSEIRRLLADNRGSRARPVHQTCEVMKLIEKAPMAALAWADRPGLSNVIRGCRVPVWSAPKSDIRPWPAKTAAESQITFQQVALVTPDLWRYGARNFEKHWREAWNR